MPYLSIQFSVVSQSCLTLCDPMDPSTPASPTPRVHSTHVHRVGDAVLCRPLFLPPSIFPSIRLFSNESVLHIGWPKYWSFSFSISPSNLAFPLCEIRNQWRILNREATWSNLNVLKIHVNCVDETEGWVQGYLPGGCNSPPEARVWEPEPEHHRKVMLSSQKGGKIHGILRCLDTWYMSSGCVWDKGVKNVFGSWNIEFPLNGMGNSQGGSSIKLVNLKFLFDI